jgi:intracellular sulfur oxidation DsrE/DsrF family protein
MKRFSIFLLGMAISALAWSQGKVAYHLREDVPQASRAIGNIRNHLAAEPNTQIVVVAHGLGIDFLLHGATNQQDQPFTGSLGEPAGRGVEFRVCNNIWMSRRIAKERGALEAGIVPSGVAEVARLQA